MRVRGILGIGGRILAGVAASAVLGGAVLVAIAYYAGVSFDVEAVGLAMLGAGVVVYLWTRWR
jgi:hypothetical protein